MNHGDTGTRRASVLLCAFVSLWFNVSAQNLRTDVLLDKSWKTVADDSDKHAFDDFKTASFNDAKWKIVAVPHNWDQYEGYRRLRHGNRHGYAWYRKTFTLKQQPKGKRIFLFFEGVGSYATVWLNGQQVGYHAGGRTTFTIDITNAVKYNAGNLLAVRADHPANIQDLPWVCGGCSDDRGFSEGSQPMGIFRPVHLVITNDVRVEPFGVHVWNDSTTSEKGAQLFTETEIRNYSNRTRKLTVLTQLLSKGGATITSVTSLRKLAKGSSAIIRQQLPFVSNPTLWSLENPYLYQVSTTIVDEGKQLDNLLTPYGIRTIRWPIGKNSSGQFFLNGKPVFINGIAEYEHLLGGSHAFSAEQIRTRVMQVKAAGFNAFRDAHQPHNLRYQNYWDSLGLLWWTQLSAHDWYDTKAFRDNFKTLLKEWVKERRNSPSLVLWGLQNESKLPKDFAEECAAIIRQLDPTTSSQRLVTTCNGGEGTDWDVPQNWTGTYGGNPATYGDDLKRQVLVGEYGAWRTLDLHTEGAFVQNGSYSEDRMTQLMEQKLRLAEAAKDSAAGHFMWLLTSHDNPGRVQGGEGYRELDRIGPVNYKGLLTPWEEPLDVFYMFRSNYAPKETEPMVYIVSHTWPDRWTKPGKKDGIVVYSNCDEVELFNDLRSQSLGRKKRRGVGTHFQWDSVDIRYNVLYAVGYVNGKEVAKDYIMLHHLPQAPHAGAFDNDAKNSTAPQGGYNYLYRVNCGGPDYVDGNGNTWLADRERKSKGTWGSVSWTAAFEGLAPYFASQRTTADPVSGTKDDQLFQSFRYGREKLRYDFPVQDGDYRVEFYFTEPWWGTGGGLDATGWRLFDVAVNGKTVLKDIDIWHESGQAAALKKTVQVTVKGGLLSITFPHVASGQAVISAIAIATKNQKARPAPPPPSLLAMEGGTTKQPLEIRDWLTTGDAAFVADSVRFSNLAPELYGAQWLKKRRAENLAGKSLLVTDTADVLIVKDTTGKSTPAWLQSFNATKALMQLDDGSTYWVYKKRMAKGERLVLDEGNYFVMALPATSMEPAYDLKPVASYKAVNAVLNGPGLSKGKVDGKDRVIFEAASPQNSVEWQIAVGVGDTYSLTISYNNPTSQTLRGQLQLVAADGTQMKQEAVELTPTRQGKSNYINTTTGSMINAGKYKVVFTAGDAKGLSINALDVQ
ncbi:malectin domain-containing carbohydrate-binding protein [Flavisolibacter nicotianae]|uniref:malectin domain-containing carbohydrate-binding protein n=1 Tax=Flavisolibacter nicotianae TaxID=2364882 RepID=UPI001F092438|nr:malectin domain-containing carbohydrate-binding protein [Flavisolibacter nicotianae]